MSETETSNYTETDWDFILESIKRGKSVLVLGPDVYKSEDGTRIEEMLSQFLKADNPEHPHIQAYYEKDGLFLFRDEKSKIKETSRIRNFYTQPNPESSEMFEKIAEIPIPIIITLFPDQRLSDTFTKLGINHEFSFYNKNKPAKEFIHPVGSVPIIYNLLGYIEEDESLVLTYEDFYSYLKSVFKNAHMDQSLKGKLKEANNFLLVGLPFEKRWYTQLLLRVFYNHISNSSFERYATGDSLNQHLKKLYSEQFKLTFSKGNAQDFLNELYKKCSEKNQLRKLKTASAVPADIPVVGLDMIIEQVAHGKTKNALKYLKIYLDFRKPISGPYFNQCVLLLSRYELLEQKAQNGLLYSQEDHVERAKINYDLLELINNTRNLA
jgi:hypothetical protein